MPTTTTTPWDCVLLRGLVVCVALVAVVHVVWPTFTDGVRRALLAHWALARAQWTGTWCGDADTPRRRVAPPPPPPPPPEAEAEGEGEGEAEAEAEVEAEAEADVRDYTPPGSDGTLRVLHPQTAEARDRLLAEGARDPTLLRQTVVTASTQYAGVSAETPVLVQTRRPPPPAAAAAAVTTT